MNDNHRDPDHAELGEALLTAYALGQLGEQECAEVEAKLARSEKARQFVEETRALGEHVFAANRQQPSPPPSTDLRAAVEDHLNEQEHPTMKATSTIVTEDKPRHSRRAWVLVAAAVCLLVAASPLLLPSFQPSRETAQMAPAADTSGDEAAAESAGPMAWSSRPDVTSRENMAYDMGDAASGDTAEPQSQDSPAADAKPDDFAGRGAGGPGGLHGVTIPAPAEEPALEVALPADPMRIKPSIPVEMPVAGPPLKEKEE